MTTWLLEFEACLAFLGVITVASAAAWLIREAWWMRKARKRALAAPPTYLFNSDRPEDYGIDTTLPETVPTEWG